MGSLDDDVREWAVQIIVDDSIGECVFFLKQEALDFYFKMRRIDADIELDIIPR